MYFHSSQAALREFEEFKVKVRAREERQAGELADQATALREEVLAVKSKSQEAMRRFADAIDKLNRAKLAEAGASKERMEEMKRRHQQEMDDLVKESNEKYTKVQEAS